MDISSIPMFIKSGAIIPMAGNELNNLMNDKVDSLHIIMAPDIDSSFTIYDDDGKTNDYKNGSYLKTDISVKAGAKTYIDFEYEGSYENTAETMELDVIHRRKHHSMYSLMERKCHISFIEENMRRVISDGITARLRNQCK